MDLIVTIFDPFSPAYRRTKFYYLFSGTTSFVLVMVIFGIGAGEAAQTVETPYDCIDRT